MKKSSNAKYHKYDKIVSDIIHNQERSDYEKYMHIQSEVVYKLIDKIEKLQEELSSANDELSYEAEERWLQFEEERHNSGEDMGW